MKRHLGSVLAAILTLGLSTGPAFALGSITIAYFPQWPMPYEYAKVSHQFEKALGLKINWRSFDTGTAISSAMASGDVQIGISQAIVNLVVETSTGLDLQLVDVAVTYSGNDNCVVSNNLDITKRNAKELDGKKVALPLGTVSQYDFLKQMQHFGVDTSTMDIVDMAPTNGAAALAEGNVDMACAWGGGLLRMEKYGHVLLTGPEKDALGIHIYDGITAPADFVSVHPDIVAKFLKVMHAMNAKWNSGPAARAKMLPVMAKESGMDVPAAKKLLSGFTFLNYDQALSKEWLGGGTQVTMKQIASYFAKSGTIRHARASYDDIVNVGPLKEAKAMAGSK